MRGGQALIGHGLGVGVSLPIMAPGVGVSLPIMAPGVGVSLLIIAPGVGVSLLIMAPGVGVSLVIMAPGVGVSFVTTAGVGVVAPQAETKVAATTNRLNTLFFIRCYNELLSV